MASYYEMLGVSKSATAAQIKSAYRKKALEWHPDRNKAANATEKFKEINSAYEVLSDEKKKSTYDQVGHDAFVRGGMGGANAASGGGGYNYSQGPFSYSQSQGGQNPFDGAGFGAAAGTDPFEVFEQFFGFQSPFGGGGGQRRARRNLYQITITFDEAVKGTEKKVNIDGKKKTIKVPAGVDTGMRIRFTDYDVLVEVKPHEFFQREGQDLYYKHKVSYPLMVLGGSIEVPTLDGKTKLKLRSGTKNGAHVRLSGKGVPYPNSKRRGDLYVVYEMDVPDKVSRKAKKLLEQLQQELA